MLCNIEITQNLISFAYKNLSSIYGKKKSWESKINEPYMCSLQSVNIIKLMSSLKLIIAQTLQSIKNPALLHSN